MPRTGVMSVGGIELSVAVDAGALAVVVESAADAGVDASCFEHAVIAASIKTSDVAVLPAMPAVMLDMACSFRFWFRLLSNNVQTRMNAARVNG
ncbi:MAG TPA: hypothetical protein VGO46_08125 [Gemmatimonadaceae bacterium]|nr:hypothetical protein [Gemmatimonadaceae bacterium]